MSQLLQEIEEQPAALARLLVERRDEVRAAAARIRSFDPAFVMIAARGTSDNAARYAQYLWGAHNKLGVALAVPSLFTLYGAPPRLDRALTVAISQSGRAPDVLAVIEEAKRQGGLTLAITNDATSPLAAAADLHLLLTTGVEKSVAATKTYTNQLLLLAMISAALDGGFDVLEQVPAWVSSALDAGRDVEQIALDFTGAGRFVVLGRGYNYCTAFEIALKMKETSYVLAEPYSIADFVHGPVAMIEYGFPVLLIAPTGVATDDIGPLLELLRWRRARTIAITDRPDVLSRVTAGVSMPTVPEWVSPIVSVIPGQLWIHALATAKGLDPDKPRGLSKITRTL